MADEKNLNETVDEAAEEITEVIEEEAVEETAQAVEEASAVDRAVAEAMAARDAQEAKAKAEKSKKIKIAAIVAAAVIVVGGIVGSGFVSRSADGGLRFNTYNGWLPKAVNKYNHMGYIDITGNTVGDLAASMGMDVADFLDEFGLPEDMPASTHEMAAVYMLPVKNYGSMYGLDFETMKELLNIPDTFEDGTEITEDSRWGDVQGEISVGDYVGDTGDGAALAEFKETFGFGDEITAETKWKEVRGTVDKYNRDMQRGSANAAADIPEDDIDITIPEDDVVVDDTAAEVDAADVADTAAE